MVGHEAPDPPVGAAARARGGFRERLHHRRGAGRVLAERFHVAGRIVQHVHPRFGALHPPQVLDDQAQPAGRERTLIDENVAVLGQHDEGGPRGADPELLLLLELRLQVRDLLDERSVIARLRHR